jgi:phenylalanyl-tRNA synthetase beta chain
LATPDAGRFTPLGFDDPLSLREILSVHPKGLEYGGILAGHERLPLLIDAEGHVLSFPPIINSRDIGEVRVGDDALFVEVTGTDFAMVGLTLNILAVNFADRGAEIDAVDIQYPYTTPGGQSVRTPSDPSKPRSIAVPEIAAALGLPMGPTEVGEALKTYGYGVSGTGQTLEATLPPYRQDVMHAVDVIEDVAISRGYQSFEPLMPSLFTVGGLSRIEQASDRVRDLMIGFGFQEIISNIMASRADLIERMRLDGTPWERLVEVDNVMSQSYACLRPSIVPSLLRVEAASGRAFYPHRLFEAGEIVLPDAADPHGSRTDVWVAALLAHAEANFSDIHSYLDLLLYYLDVPYRLEALDHPSFLAGRAGRVLCDGRLLGLIGELHPEVLEQWQIGMPVSVFEVSVSEVMKRTA